MVMTNWPFDLPDPSGTKHELTRIQLLNLKRHDRRAYRDFFELMLQATGIFPNVVAGLPLDLIAGTVDDSIALNAGAAYISDPATYVEFAGLVDWTDTNDILIENFLGRTYHVGMQVQEVPVPSTEGVRANGRTKVIEYVQTRLEVGELGEPDSLVFDVPTQTFTFVVDTVYGANGRNHGPRQFRIWLRTPETDTADAFVTLNSTFSGGQHVLQLLPGEVFGMTAAEAAAVGAGDFDCIMIGPRVTDAPDLSTLDQYLYLGNVTGTGAGNPVGVIDTTGVSRYSTSLGLADLDITTLYTDVYKTPSRDGDGLANRVVSIEQALMPTLALQQSETPTSGVPIPGVAGDLPSIGAGLVGAADDFFGRAWCGPTPVEGDVGPAHNYTANMRTTWELLPNGSWSPIETAIGVDAVPVAGVLLFYVETDAVDRISAVDLRGNVATGEDDRARIGRPLDVETIQLGDYLRGSAAERSIPRARVRFATGGGAGYTAIGRVEDDASPITAEASTWVRHADGAICYAHNCSWDGAQWVRGPAGAFASLLVMGQTGFIGNVDAFFYSAAPATFPDADWSNNATASTFSKVISTVGQLSAGADLSNSDFEEREIARFLAVMPGADRGLAFAAGSYFSIFGLHSVAAGTDGSVRGGEIVANCYWDSTAGAPPGQWRQRTLTEDAWKLDLTRDGMILYFHGGGEGEFWNDTVNPGTHWTRVIELTPSAVRQNAAGDLVSPGDVIIPNTSEFQYSAATAARLVYVHGWEAETNPNVVQWQKTMPLPASGNTILSNLERSVQKIAGAEGSMVIWFGKYVPHGATITQIIAHVRTGTGASTAARAIPFRVATSGQDSTNAGESLRSATGGILALTAQAADAVEDLGVNQNNIVDREGYSYGVWFDGETSSVLKVYSIRVDYTVSRERT